MFYFTVCIIFFGKVLLFPDSFTLWLFDYTDFKDKYIKYFIFILGVVNFIVCFVFESAIIPFITRIYYKSKYFDILRSVQTQKYNPNLKELQDIKKENKFATF